MRKLLLVEDDRIIANIYQRKFTLDGYDVRVCENGREAIARFDEFHPEVVILDLNLPVLNGFEVLRHIRLQSADLPVVVFSNAYQPQLVQSAWEGGASAVLMKANTNPKKMSETIQELLASANSPTALSQSAPATPSSPAREPVAPTPPPHRIAPAAEAPALEGLPQFLKGFRHVHEEFLDAADAPSRRAALIQLSRATNGLAAAAATAGMTSMARVAEAYQALLQAMHDRDDLVTDSTRRSSRIGLESITALGEPGVSGRLKDIQAQALLADGDHLSTRMATFALDKAGIDTIVVDHAETAIKTLHANPFNLVALDSDLPGMTALDCAHKLRNVVRMDAPLILLFPAYEFPQVLPTAESLRADLVAKPYPAAELALVALCRVYRHRLARAT